MTRTATADRTAQATLDLDALERRQSAGEVVPFEEIREEIAAQPRTVAVVAASDVEEAAKTAARLAVESIKLTHAPDWVLYADREGNRFGYLQDVGCQRILGLWGISFERTDLNRDVVKEEVEGGNFQVTAQVFGRCAILAVEDFEVGYRNATGLFGPAWEKAQGNPVERERLKADVLKSALANGRGRFTRRVTGLNRVPVERLEALGLDSSKMGNVQHQQGTRGGAGTGASDAQIKAITAEALKAGKVAGLDQAMSWDEVEAAVREAKLSGGRQGKASALIERLKAADKGAVTIEQFEQALGVKLNVEEGE